MRRRQNVELTDEELYQRTRRIVIAEMQNVVYGQWLREVVCSTLFTFKLVLFTFQ